MVGTSLKSLGGMTSVIKVYRDCGLFDACNVHYVSAYERPGLLNQCRVAIPALLQFLWMLVFAKVALLHVHSASRGSFWRKSVFCAMARVFKVPYLFHLHSGEFPIFANQECGPMAQRWIRHTLSRASTVVALTSSWSISIKELAPNAYVVVIGNPITLPDAPATVMRTRTKLNVLFLGRLREKKGVFDLIKAMPAILARFPDATFTLAGDGDLAAVAKQADLIGVRNSLILPGWVDGVVKDALLAEASVLVLPSYFEGLPICVLEAMAMGVPVVATSVGGIPEALEYGDCGTLVCPGDVSGIATAVINALASGDEIASSRDRALARVRKHYAASAILEQLSAIYRVPVQSEKLL